MTAPTPAIPTWTNGQTLTATGLNAYVTNLLTLYTQTQGGFRTVKPLCVVYRAALGGPSTGVDTLIPYDTELANSDNMWAGSTQDHFLVNTAGIYHLAQQTHWTTAATGIRAQKIMINGTNPSANAVATDCRNPVTIAEGTVTYCSTIVNLAVGALIYGNIFQNSGGTVQTIPDFSGCFMSAEWISPP